MACSFYKQGGWSENIYVGIGTNPGINPGIYIQGTGKLHFGNYTTVGQNSGIMSGSHDFYDHRILTKSETKIGNYSWIGMNAVVLPGVVLRDKVNVASGLVVSKSFPEGNCIIGGVPARKLKELHPERFIELEYKSKYQGYIREDKFKKFREKNLDI